MYSKYKELELLQKIKIIPIVIIIIFSIIITLIIINKSISKNNNDLKNLKTTFINNKKNIIKNATTRVARHIIYQKKLSEEKMRIDLKYRTEEIYKRILIIYNKNKHKSKTEIIKLIKENIRYIRFYNGRGYFFINDMEGTNILQPIFPEYEGKNIINLQDKKGTYLIKNILNIKKLKEQEGFTSYYWNKPDNKKEVFKKVSFSKYIKQLDFIITTGEYLSNFEENIKQELIQEIQQIRFGKNGYTLMHQ